MPTVIDYSSARPSDAQLDAMGLEGVTRYLTIPDTNFNRAKQLTKPEYDHLIGKGFTVLLNWEHEKASWAAGYPLGRQHGVEARRQADALAAPAFAVIVQSVDTDIFPFQYSVALEYQRGFNDGVGRGPQGMYGTDPLLRRAMELGLIKVAWQTMSRGWFGNGQDCPVAALIQRSNHDWYDRNDVMRPHWGAVNECVFGYRCFKA